MIHSKAIDVLKTFTKDELKQFSDFVRSPFHNKNKNLIKFYDELKKFHPEFNVENEKIYLKVYPGKSYSNDNMKKLKSEMMGLAEKFLIEIRFKKKHITRKLYLIRQLNRKKLDHLFLSYSKKLEIEIENDDSKLYENRKLQKYIVNFYNYRYQHKNAINNLFKRSMYSIHIILQMLDSDTNDTTACKWNFNLKNKLFLTNIFNKNFDYDSFLKDIKENNFENEYLKLKCNFIALMKNPEKEIYYEEAEQLVFNIKNNFLAYPQKHSGIEKFWVLQNYIISLRNYCKLKSKLNKIQDQVLNDKYLRKFFELCKIELDVRRAYHKGEFKVEIPLYNLITSNGIELEEYDYVEQFINNTKIYSDSEQQKNTYNLAMSNLELARKNYGKSLRYASECHNSFWMEKNKIKHNILTCYYELNLLESAKCLIDSYNHYLSNTEELPENSKKQFKDFIYFYNEILKLKLNIEKFDGFVIQNIRSKLSKTFIIYQSWLINKLNELDNTIAINNKRDNKKLNQKKSISLKSA